MRLTPRSVAERLDAELGDARLVYGQPQYRRLPGGFWMVAPQPREAGPVAHLVALSWGVPPAEELAGVAWGVELEDRAGQPGTPRWYGRTDARGQFWVRGLLPGSYFVRYAPWVRSALDVRLLEALGDRAARVTLRAAAEHAPSADLREQARRASERLRPRPLDVDGLQRLARGEPGELTVAWEGRRAWLRADGGGAPVILGVEGGDDLGPAPLVRVRLLDPDEEVLAEGFLGLAQNGSGRRTGAADLDLLAEGWRDYDGPLQLWLNPQPLEALDERDYEALEHSHRAGPQPFREAIELARARVRHVSSAALPASAFGVPLPDAVLAVLPTGDWALTTLVREALKAAIQLAGPRAPAGVLVEQARTQLIGRARLSPADELRLYERAARELERLRIERITAGEPSTGGPSHTPGPASRETREDDTIPIEQARRLAELEGADTTDRLQGRIYRLAEHAGLNPEKIAELLGMTAADVAFELGLAAKTVGRS
jgi:hypothetical protein